MANLNTTLLCNLWPPLDFLSRSMMVSELLDVSIVITFHSGVKGARLIKKKKKRNYA